MIDRIGHIVDQDLGDFLTICLYNQALTLILQTNLPCIRQCREGIDCFGSDEPPTTVTATDSLR